MFTAIRTKVSGSRRRYTDNNYNLDLTYICNNRIIVMSFPASGFIHTSYRNNHQTVKRFLDERHPNKYWVYNVTERLYESSRFDDRVSLFSIEDHHAPHFHLLFQLVDHMYKWLKRDPENVVVIHCNSGKGRAGSAACCLMLYTGLFDNIQDCVKLFGARRFTDNKGLS